MIANRFHFLLGVILLVSPALAQGADPDSATDAGAAAEPSVDYQRDVRSVLQDRCVACHGPLKQEAGLRLDTARSMRTGGDSGPAIVVDDAPNSPLIQRISESDASLRMPPEGEPVPSAQIAAIARWIASGAPAPRDEQPSPDPRRHWSFQPLMRPVPPTVENAAWVLNPIDAFVANRHEAQGLRPRPMAEKHTLLRRVYLDLIGMPPTREELHAFFADESPTAYETVVERLLDDPRYGERWGRHWMDVWRYSDWYGRRHVPDVWNSAPQIWRWRDWIVRSLNDDKGYDRMLQEMLAADEICGQDDEATVATGYLIRNWYALNPNDWMRNTAEHTAKAFLGLTFNCAHCHDHKYDPIAQDDYFRLRAFFEPMGIRQDRVPGEPDPGPYQEYDYSTLRKIQWLGAVRIHDKNPAVETWFYTDGDERNRIIGRGSIPPGVPEFLSEGLPEIAQVELPPGAWNPGTRPAIHATLRKEAQTRIAAAEKELKTAREVVTAALPALQQQLAQREAEIQEALSQARASDQPGALVGKQSLLLEARSGRRLVQHGLQHVKHLDDGSLLRFQLQILSDAHVNFQLAKDWIKGLTAGYVAFDQGRILSYQPGTFTEFEVGRYDAMAGQLKFEVSLRIQTGADRCLLTVRSLSDDATLVDQTPVALNGWNPVGDPTKAITFDAHAGSAALVDEVVLLGADTKTADGKPADGTANGNPAASTALGDTTPLGDTSAADPSSAASPARLAYFDFEAPDYQDGRDVINVDGWTASPFGQEPGISLVTSTGTNETLRALGRQRFVERQAVAAQELKLQAAELKLAASQAALASLESTIAADEARYGKSREASSQYCPTQDSTTQDSTVVAAADEKVAVDNVDTLAHTAARAQHTAAQKQAELAVREKQQLLAAAEALPLDNDQGDNDQRDAQIQQAAAAVSEAKAALLEVAQPTVSESTDIGDADSEATVSESPDAGPTSVQAVQDAALAYTPLGPTYPRTSTGRRKALALWMTADENPLTARVAINHIWMRHFHAPLVKSVFDFGINGEAPTHPQLLDWLAVELRESGWSMKRIHRLIVCSATYRMRCDSGMTARIMAQSPAESKPPAAATHQTIDPENRFLWRMNSGRMEAEVVRDSLLYCAGRLDLTRGGQGLENSEALTTNRRSLYYSYYPEAGGMSPLSELFDAPDPLECYRRTRSIVPQQALALTNSELVHDISAALAASIWAGLPNAAGSSETDGTSEVAGTASAADSQTHQSQFIVRAFETILSRRPTTAEIDACESFLLHQAKLIAQAAQRGAAPAATTDPQAENSTETAPAAKKQKPAEGASQENQTPHSDTPQSDTPQSQTPQADSSQAQARESLVRVLFNHNDFVTIR
jgi:mono/diheme cytochrome c family protein